MPQQELQSIACPVEGSSNCMAGPKICESRQMSKQIFHSDPELLRDLRLSVWARSCTYWALRASQER